MALGLPHIQGYPKAHNMSLPKKGRRPSENPEGQEGRWQEGSPAQDAAAQTWTLGLPWVAREGSDTDTATACPLPAQDIFSPAQEHGHTTDCLSGLAAPPCHRNASFTT